MKQNLASKKEKLNVQVSSELKNKLFQISTLQGKKVSVLVRESIEEKLMKIEKKMFEEDMKRAYLGMAQENLEVSKDFEIVDTENLK